LRVPFLAFTPPQPYLAQRPCCLHSELPPFSAHPFLVKPRLPLGPSPLPPRIKRTQGVSVFLYQLEDFGTNFLEVAVNCGSQRDVELLDRLCEEAFSTFRNDLFL